MLNPDQSGNRKAANATPECQGIVECASHRSLFGTQLDPVSGKPAKSEGALANDDCAVINDANNPPPAQDLTPLSMEQIAADIKRNLEASVMHMRNEMLNNTSANRPATLEEMECAHHVLMSFSGPGSDLKNSILNLEMTMLKQGIADEDSECRPLVVRDFFGVIDSRAEFLLVPSGTYDIPSEFFQRNNDRCIIGLPWKKADYPTLRLEGFPWQKSHSSFANTRGPETVPHVIDASDLRFANVRLDAVVPTVLEISAMEIEGGFLTGLHQHVEYGEKIEVLDNFGDKLCLGRKWARAAYGPECGVRHTGIRMLEGAYMGLLSGVDGIFKPLVGLGERIDRVMGWK